MRIGRSLSWLLCLMLLFAAAAAEAKTKNKPKKKKDKFNNITKIIENEPFTEALKKLAVDERVPVASTTLVEKGRGEGYYSVEKMLDRDSETFWAEGAKGWGKNEWVAFNLPEGTTHVEVTPGAGKEQFENFNRPRTLFLDVYLVKLKRNKETDKYEPKFRWLGRNTYNFKNKPKTVRKKVTVKLPELALAERTMYIGVLIIQKIFKGQFDDTSISELHTTSVWGSE